VIAMLRVCELPPAARSYDGLGKSVIGSGPCHDAATPL
jgi:hypothetical protein